MEVGNTFNDLQSYLDNMAKGLEDKLFFLKHLPRDKKYIFVDFGCADGSLIEAMYHMAPWHVYIGYDISKTMIVVAKNKFSQDSKNVLFTSDWTTVTNKIDNYPKNYQVITILSSVVHEIYSYAENSSEIDKTFSRIFEISDTICIRDMMCSKDFDRFADSELYEKVKLSNNPLISDFEEHWGSITTVRNLIHFLLKYKWTINWDREVNENYFPIAIEDFLKMFEKDYNLVYLERFRNPFLELHWQEDFGIKLDDYTHVKLIFQLK